VPQESFHPADLTIPEFDDFSSVLEHTTVHRSTIGCVVPAYNEEESIADVLRSLLGQSRVPDVIHVVVNNTSDATVKIASEFSGPHEITTELGEQFTEVFVHDIGKNPDKKVGALNYGYALVEGYDYLLGVDGDTIADRRAVEFLEAKPSATPASAGSLRSTRSMTARSRASSRSSSSPASARSSRPSTCRTCCAGATWRCWAGSSRSSRRRRCAMS
jgi:hypothetical protein